jgi:uncharacterized protein (DUF427 family)
MKAVWNEVILAESNRTIVVEGNHYFPSDAIRPEYFQASGRHTTCAWKGVASYYDIVVDGQANPGAAWTYPTPQEAARQIQGYVAFWRGVQVVK